MGRILLFCYCCVCVAGCQKQDAASNVNQFEMGEKLYTTYCAGCHETDNGIGPKLIAEVVATRVNGQLLYNYNKRNMPYQAGNTLKDEEYWAITAYMLIRDGFLEENTSLSEENAKDILLGTN